MTQIKVLSQKEIETLLIKSSTAKEIINGDTIEKLKSGEGFLINVDEFSKLLKTPIPTYYSSKYKKKGNDIIDVKKVGDSYLIRKK